MAKSRYGFSALNNNLNSSTSNLGNNLPNISTNNTAVRVKSIVLDENHPRFNELGGWNGLGTIEFQSVENPLELPIYPTARPIYPNVKNYPLENEIVFLLSMPNTNIGSSTTSTQNYYISVISLWNHPHHNGYPSNPNTPPPTQQKDYQQTGDGSVRRVTDQSTEINLGKTFKERSNIHPLLPFEGDVIYEGRWGNSIRIGSTVKNTPNIWSSDGNNGDPIMIIRNGQSVNTSPEGWIPIVEDINNDISSIYVTSTQKLPLKSSTPIDYFSYKTNKPDSPNQYSGPQIVLNSGRLILNSKTDHILLSSKKSINLNAVDSINFDTAGNVIIQSGKLFLGSKDATEPVLLGDTTIKLLTELVNSLNQFMIICSNAVSTTPGTPLGTLNAAATQMNVFLEDIISNKKLENAKSNNNYTI
jgi:hypothetical protein